MRKRLHPERVFERGGARVEVVPLEGAARLVTLRLEAFDPSYVELVQGAIVRVVPSGESTSEQRVAYLARLRQLGAAHAWLAPPEASPEAVARDPAEPGTAPEEPARVIIGRMVDEARTRDRDRLRQVVEGALARAGL